MEQPWQASLATTTFTNKHSAIVFSITALFAIAIVIKIMKNCLVISDLNHLEEIGDNSIIGGYVSVSGFTLTMTNSSSAFAVAEASAIGDYTYTNTHTNVTNRNIGFIDYSNANATAISYAYSNGQAASYWSSSSSISIELNYG